MINQVYKTLPDDRPIRSICIVEDLDKCPKGYVAVARTHDQDADADLWRESGFFGKKCSRYLCLSKTEGYADQVIQSILIINEKDTPPEGYTSTTLTYDSAQKAWRKRQMCFKYVPQSTTTSAVTDIIALSRMKKAPEEFSLLGEINGMTLCYKIGKIHIASGNPSISPQIPYRLRPGQNDNTNALSTPNYQNIYPSPSLNKSDNEVRPVGSNDENPLVPSRPAPKPPASYATISGYSGLDGVPFILNPKWNFTNSNQLINLPKPKTRTEIDFEYKYEFRTERET